METLLARGARLDAAPNLLASLASGGTGGALLEKLLASKPPQAALDAALVGAAGSETADLALPKRLRAAGAKDLDAALRAAVVRAATSRELLDWLHAEGARVDAADPRRNTPLHLAAVALRADAVAWLLERKADPRARDGYGKLPIEAVHAANTQATPERRAVMDLLAKAGGLPEDPVPKAPAAPAPLAAGDAVSHATFGAGRVLTVRGDKVEVEFESAGKKLLLARLVTRA